MALISNGFLDEKACSQGAGYVTRRRDGRHSRGARDRRPGSFRLTHVSGIEHQRVIKVRVEAAKGLVGIATCSELLKLRQIVELKLLQMKLFEGKNWIETDALTCLEVVRLRG